MSAHPYLPVARTAVDDSAVARVSALLLSGGITGRTQVEAFERSLSSYLGGRPVRAVSSASAAIELALRICGIGPGDEVIVPGLSPVAPHLVVKVGATPVFVDVEPGTRNLDLTAVEARVGPRTRALMPAHFAGLPMPLDDLYSLARRHSLRVIENVTGALGASWRGKRIGSCGDICVFDFGANDTLTTIEGGALSFAEEKDARELDRPRFRDDVPSSPAGACAMALASDQFIMPELHAAIGVPQLEEIALVLRKRHALVQRYYASFRSDPPCVLPHQGYSGDQAGHGWHSFAPLLPLHRLSISRQQFREELERRGIGTAVPCAATHLTRAFRDLGYRRGDLPQTERIADIAVTLPLSPAMSDSDVDRVCAACAEVLRSSRT